MGMEESWQNVGLRVREAREARGLTRRDLAADLGVTEGAVQQWEDGRGVFEFRRLGPLAMALGVSCDWLVFGGPPPSTHTSEDERIIRAVRRLSEVERRLVRRMLNIPQS